MSFEDRYVTATPEGVSLDVALAGLGSRFIAYALDWVVQVAAFVIADLVTLRVVLHHASETAVLVGGGVLALFAFLDFIGYFIACELLFSGRTLGKRVAGIRVVRVGGQPVGFWSSLLRNVLRLVDSLPGVYLVGSILILSTKRNQRLGDLVANTIVIRERLGAVPSRRPATWADAGGYGVPAGQYPGAAGPWSAGFDQQSLLPPELSHWDVSAVPEAELAMARTFLANRWGYEPAARARLAAELANRIWPYVAGPTVPPHPEVFLESVLRVKAARG